MEDSNTTQTRSTSNTNSNQNEQHQSIQGFFIANRIDSILWLIRLYIIFSSLLFFVPLFGTELGASSYKKVLIGSAAISALRLHQRLPRIQLTIQFAKDLLLQDSFHYLIYSVLFLTANSTSMVLLPILLFAVMHATNYTQKVLNISRSSSFLALKLRQLINKIDHPETQQQLLQFIATIEIMVFFTTILMAFSGQGTILTPLFYYRFLQLRYTSRRNPYSRLVFNQFRLGIEQIACHPKCPSIVRRVLYGVVSIANRLSPSYA
ncbi:transmembrane protein 33 isoform X1 [Hydra vulgaris]|uniref:Transmembrane protein 33 n=1 Tax=Hydra vulgaris TaxID=6087 RepID=T2MEZ7_HYDVU|nr:transmembrane protein 33 [Hydra vulgaris]